MLKYSINPVLIGLHKLLVVTRCQTDTSMLQSAVKTISRSPLPLLFRFVNAVYSLIRMTSPKLMRISESLVYMVGFDIYRLQMQRQSCEPMTYPFHRTECRKISVLHFLFIGCLCAACQCLKHLIVFITLVTL
jgi:predicted RNA methylase